MKRKYLYNNILHNGFELFGDIKYEDDYLNEYEEEEDFQKNINKDIEDIDRLVNELGILEEEENEDNQINQLLPEGGEVKPDQKMGYISTVEDARKILEEVWKKPFKNNKES